MTGRTPTENAATGRQPVTVWKCVKCGRVSREEWVGGNHVRLGASDFDDPEQRCRGEAEQGFWLAQDEYLDWLLEGSSA